MEQETFSVKCDKLVISGGDIQWTKFRNKKLNQKANELVVVERDSETKPLVVKPLV